MKIRDEADHHGVTETLREWRQGDCVISDQGFLFRSDPANPLTRAGALAAAFAGAAEVEVPGFMVVTQTCDIVSYSGKRPFMEVCPLVRVGGQKHREIELMRWPGYALIPSLASDRLVADLDRVMTVEKSVVANWKRVPGCLTDDDRRRLSEALARKRSRRAFPDDFVTFAKPLQEWVSTNHKPKKKNTDEGRALRAIDEIRVHAAPSWEADRIELNFLFIRNQENPEFEQQGWSDHHRTWLKLVKESGRFGNVNVRIMPLEELRASDYVDSDPMDFDHLSMREEPGGAETGPAP